MTTTLTGLSPLHPTIPHVIVYSTTTCTICPSVKRRLTTKGIPFLVVNLDDERHVSIRKAVNDYGIAQVPAVVVHNVWDTGSGSHYWTGIGAEQLRQLTKSYPDAINRALAGDTSAETALAAAQELDEFHTIAHRITNTQAVVDTTCTPDRFVI